MKITHSWIWGIFEDNYVETRRLGCTEHKSSVAMLGGFAFYDAAQKEADALMEKVIETGVNYMYNLSLSTSSRRMRSSAAVGDGLL